MGFLFVGIENEYGSQPFGGTMSKHSIIPSMNESKLTILVLYYSRHDVPPAKWPNISR